MSENNVCSACGGDQFLRTSPFHGASSICRPCFIVWYDYMGSGDDSRDPAKVGARSLELKAAGKFPWAGEYAP